MAIIGFHIALILTLLARHVKRRAREYHLLNDQVGKLGEPDVVLKVRREVKLLSGKVGHLGLYNEATLPSRLEHKLLRRVSHPETGEVSVEILGPRPEPRAVTDTQLREDREARLYLPTGRIFMRNT